MKKFRLDSMIRGWYVGDFEPTAFATNHCELSCSCFPAGYSEPKHYHKISTEITLVTRGEIKLDDEIYREGDIIVKEPMEATKLSAVTDCEVVTIKVPQAKDDKYIGEPE